MADSTAGNDRPGRKSHPPFAHPGAMFVAPSSAGKPEHEDLPSIQQFLDDLPSVDDFLDQEFEPGLPSIDDYIDHSAPEVGLQPMAPESQPMEYDVDGWAVAGWQFFDWGGAASLGTRNDHGKDSGTRRSEANRGGGVMPRGQASSLRRQTEGARPTADEVATALDGIAQRIRSGELVIDQFIGTPPDAAMAAALAVLLRMRG